MMLTNLVEIKGYEAGKEGNLLVSLDESLEAEGKYTNAKGDKERHIRLTICGAYVEDNKLVDELEEHCDSVTPCDMVIVVGKDFMRLTNKNKLALLEVENKTLEAMESMGDIESPRVFGEICAMEKFGILRTLYVTRKADRKRRRSEALAARGLHRAYKKNQKKAAKEAKAEQQKQQETKKEEVKPEAVANATPAPEA